MRKIFSGFSLMVAAISAVAGNPAQMIRFNDNSSVAIQASTGNINRLFVKGDKITQHVAPQGTFIFDKRQSRDGSLYFKPVYPGTPFSIFFATQNGHHFSALIEPVQQNGKTIEMIPNNVTTEQVRWEKNAGYLNLLQQLMLAMIKGVPLKGMSSEQVKEAKYIQALPSIQIKLTRVYAAGHINGFTYQINNTSNHSVRLYEREFWHQGVRAVALSDQVLAPHHGGVLYTIINAGQ